MSRGLNKVLIIGNLGRDPEMRTTPAGKAVTNFSLGVTREWHEAEGGQREETEWFNVVAWGGLAEVCQQLSQGQQVYIEGRLQSRQWQNQDGETVRTTEVVAKEMILLSGRRERVREA